MRGDGQHGPDRQMGAVFILADAVADLQHVQIVPVAGPGELAQAVLLVEDAA